MNTHEAASRFDTASNSAHIPARAAAEILGVSEATIWRMAKAGKLTAKKIGERATRFNVGEIRKLIAV